MPQQLIYTSVPRGLVPGRSGYCTVARSAGMREALMLRLEQLSYYQHLSLAGRPERPIAAYRVVDIRGSRFHVLSRIQDAGLDYTGRTNFIAHHLVLAPEEIRLLATPAVILRDWPGWVTAWDKEPQQLSNEDWGSLNSLAGTSSLPAQTWQRLTGDAVNGYGLLELKPGICLGIEGMSEKEALSLLAESAELLELRDTRRNLQTAAWQYTFSTSTQEQDNPADFRWRLVHSDTPGGARIAGTSCLPLSSLRTSGATAEERAFARTGWQAPCSVELAVDKGTISEGESVRLEARANGVPYPKFRWFEIEHGKPVELAGRSGPVLQEQPTGRAKRYMVQAENRAGFKDSQVVEVSIRQPVRLASREPMLVQPKAGRPGSGRIRTEEEMEDECRKWKERQALEVVPRKRRIGRVLSASAAILVRLAVAVLVIMKWRTGSWTGATKGAASTNAVVPGTNGPVVSVRSASRPVGTNPPSDASPAGIMVGASHPNESSAASSSQTNNATNSSAGPGEAGSPAQRPAAPPKTQSTGAPLLVAQPASSSWGLPLDDLSIPRPWEQRVVGGVSARTSAQAIKSTFMLTGGGKTIGDTDESFFFLQQRLVEPVVFSACLLKVDRMTPRSLCGIMIRESDDVDAPFVFVGRSSDKIVSIYRDTKGLGCPQASEPISNKKQVISFRILEKADSFITEYLLDGTEWTPLGPPGPPGPSVASMRKGNWLVGFAVCSGNMKSTVTASFDKILWTKDHQ